MLITFESPPCNDCGEEFTEETDIESPDGLVKILRCVNLHTAAVIVTPADVEIEGEEEISVKIIIDGEEEENK